MTAHKLSAVLFALIMLAASVAIALLAVSAGRADHAPYYRADGAIVFGDWGLYRPGHVAPWVEGPYVVGAPRFGTGFYFPSNRNDPGAYQRRPPVNGVPVPPEPYFRSWSSESGAWHPWSATVYPPFAGPDVIYAPRLEPDKHGKKSSKN